MAEIASHSRVHYFSHVQYRGQQKKKQVVALACNSTRDTVKQMTSAIVTEQKQMICGKERDRIFP